jgi:hypothetical protein
MVVLTVKTHSVYPLDAGAPALKPVEFGSDCGIAEAMP